MPDAIAVYVAAQITRSARTQFLRRVKCRPGASTMGDCSTGRSPDPQVARWQDRLTPLQRRLAGGCHLNRPISQLVAGSGLTLTALDTYYIKGLKPVGYTFEGRARKP